MSRVLNTLGVVVLLSLSLPHFQTYSQVHAWRKKFVSAATTVGINPWNPSTVFAEGALGTFYVSYDKGTSWLSRPSPGFTQVRQILVHPSDTLTMFCAAFGGGLRKSTNYGASWYTVVPGYGIDGESITYDPVHPDTMYAGNFADGALYRSTDRGETWLQQGVTGSVLCALAVRPDSVNILYAGTGGGTLSKSTDYGATWHVAISTSSGGEIPRIVTNLANPLIAYATVNGGSGRSGVWKTTDGGQTWNPTALQYVSMWSMEEDPDDPNIVYAGTFQSTLNTVYQTTDGGASWNSMPEGMPVNGYQWSLKLHPLDRKMLWASVTNGVFGIGGIYRRSTSLASISGEVLDSLTATPVSSGVIRIPATADSVDLTVSGGSFTFYYYDGDPSLSETANVTAYPYYPHDEQFSFILDSSRIQNILLRKLSSSFIHGVVEDSLTGNPVAATVSVFINTPRSQIVLVDSTDVNGLFHFDSLYISYPGVVAYPKVQVDPYELPFTAISLGPFSLDTLGLNLTVNPRADVFLVGEDSANYASYYISALQALGYRTYFWNTVIRGPAPLHRVNAFQKNFVIYFTGSKHTPLSRVQLDSLDSYLSEGGNLFLTGQDIVELNDTTHLVRDLLGVSYLGNTYIVVVGLGTNDLFSSMGFLIVGVGGASDQSSPDQMAILKANVYGVFASGSAGANGVTGIRYQDSATGGKLIFTGFGFEAISGTTNRQHVMQKVVGYLDGSIVLGVSNPPSAHSPSSFSLEQNYPNPFNPRTTIRFTLPRAGIVSLIVYNVLGEKVASVLDNVRVPGGRREVQFDARNMPSGVYLYRLTERGQEEGRYGLIMQETKRMVLLK